MTAMRLPTAMIAGTMISSMKPTDIDLLGGGGGAQDGPVKLPGAGKALMTLRRATGQPVEKRAPARNKEQSRAPEVPKSPYNASKFTLLSRTVTDVEAIRYLLQPAG